MSIERLFDVTNSTITDLWDRILTSQVDSSFALELAWYYNFPEWHHARTVLDLGTGNGDYLARLAHRFPGKKYLGVDLSSGLIEIANRRYAGGAVSFECGDLFDTLGHYDFVILRATVQHLQDLPRLVARLGELLREGGAAIVVDSDDKQPYFYWPAVPRVYTLLADLRREQTQAKSIKGGILDALVRMIDSSESLEVMSDETTAIPTTVDDNLERLRWQYRMIFQLLKKTGAVAADFPAIEREWETWCRLKDAYAETRIRSIRVTRRPRRVNHVTTWQGDVSTIPA